MNYKWKIIELGRGANNLRYCIVYARNGDAALGDPLIITRTLFFDSKQARDLAAHDGVRNLNARFAAQDKKLAAILGGVA